MVEHVIMNDNSNRPGDIVLPVKRTTGETIEERLTANAYHNILPARYQHKDENGDVVETQEELFERIPKNVAVPDIVYKADEMGLTVTVTPEQIQPRRNESSRQEVAEEVFGEGTSLDDDVEVELTEHNAWAFAYDTLVPELENDDLREHAESVYEMYYEQISNLKFTPNSPTWMGAGNEIQQLSACFVNSPKDDMTDIHDTAKEAALTFQCLTDDSKVILANGDRVSVADVGVGDEVVQRNGDSVQTETVEDVFEYENAPVLSVENAAGIDMTGTENHKLLVNGDWKEIGDIEVDDTLHVKLGYAPEATEYVGLETVSKGGQWDNNSVVDVDELVELHSRGLSDYEIADEMDIGSSTAHRWRSNVLDLPTNSNTGRQGRDSPEFDSGKAIQMYENGNSDSEIAETVGASKSAIKSFRLRNNLERNGNAVNTVQQPTLLTEDVAELVGLWVGDGSYSSDGIRFSINREEVVDRIDTLSQNLFDSKITTTHDGGCYEVVINSNEVKRWWSQNFGGVKPSAPEASVPEPIFESNRNVINSFIKGLFTADGTLTDGRYPSLVTASNELADEVQQLLVSVGVPAFTRVDEYENPFGNGTVTRNNVHVTTETGIKNYTDNIGWIDHRNESMKDVVTETEFRSGQHGHVEDNTWHVPVEDVTDAGEANVYDIQMEGDAEYLADSIVSHNSGGGVGYDFSSLRPYGDTVGSTGGISSGPITFMETFDQVCGTIAAGGSRRGAQMGVMHVWHPDIIQFIHSKNKDVSLAHTLKLNDPDDFTHNSFAEALEEARDLIGEDGKVPKFLRNAVEGHLSNFNISVGITDDFMEALENDEMFTLKNPRTDEPHIATEETKELYSQFDLGEYVTVGEVLEIPAGEIWGRIVDGAYENGEPGVVYIERMNKTHSFDTEKHPEHQINATNPCGEQELEEYESCLVGDQTVLTDDGVRQIEDFDDGSLVTSDSGMSEIATDARLIPQGEKDVVRVEVDGKMPITCTPDHVFMTDKGEVEAQDLIDEDAKVKWMGNNPLTSTVDMDSEDAWRAFSIGWIHGDGWLTENSIGISFNAEDGDFEVKERVLEHYHDLFGERKPLKDDGVSYQEQTDASAAFEVADELGFNYAQATERSLPDVFYEYSENEQLAFLRGLFTADAGVGGKTNKQIKYATSSYELADEIQKVLGSFGIQTRRYVNTFDERNDQIQIKISKASARKYMEYVGLETSSKQDQFVSGGHNYTDNEYLEVVSIEDAGTETVYDLNVPETNVFHTNGMLVHNCNLGHINLSTLVAEQNGSNPDFRAFMEEKGVDPDELTEEEAQPYVEEFLEYAINWEDIDERITSGIRFLDNVITMSDFPVEKYNEKVMGNRKVGLGIMGLAQMFIQMGVKYGSPVANEITRQVMTYINHEGKQVSADLADERGVFDEWNKSKYANPTEYPDWFEHHTGLDPNEYEDGFELRNHDVTTIAPTGTTSMVGNTSGGCEPLYNVAYYKNVSQDVQGDEMLVEFDDYFLRTLEANDIDVDAVKREAQELMENNEFNGAESLETVPDAISELFITTGELTAKEHAGVQCAAQDGVDASISKTTNAANDSTREDADEVFRYIYENGGKGVTYYRDGTRSKQVLTTRAQNTEFSDMDEDEAAEFIREKIEDVFGDVETFVGEQFDGRSVVESAELSAQGDVDVESVFDTQDGFITVRDRPDTLNGITNRIETGYGKVYVTVNVDSNGDPFELIANIGNSGGYTNSFTEALAKTVSIALRSGVDPNEIVTELRGTRSPKVAWHNSTKIQSIPDAIGYALQQVLDDTVDAGRSENVGSDVSAVTTDDSTSDDGDADDSAGGDTNALIDSGEAPECPECNGMNLYYSEGCKTCEDCGWSEC